MNSRERVIRPIERRTPDRVPITHATLSGAVARYGAALDDLAGISFRTTDGGVRCNPPRPRISDFSELASPYTDGTFDRLRERYPELEIPFDKILLVGRAYRDISEFERAYLVFRATIDASFISDAVEQESCPDDEQNIDSEQECLGM